MVRLIATFAFFLIVCAYCPAFATNGEAFLGMTSDMSGQADPATRSFLQEIAIKLKNDWHEPSLSPCISVIATFGKNPDKAWHVDSPALTNVSLDYAKIQDKAVQLVQKTLSGTSPPNKQPLTVSFDFDTWLPVIPEANGDINFGPYMVRLQRAVKSNWFLNKEPQKNTKTVIDFVVNQNGSISDVHLVTSSHCAEHDKAALKAINDSSPLLPLSCKIPNAIDIEYTFQYQLHPKVKQPSEKRFVIHLSQPKVVTAETAISNVSKNNGKFRRF